MNRKMNLNGLGIWAVPDWALNILSTCGALVMGIHISMKESVNLLVVCIA